MNCTILGLAYLKWAKIHRNRIWIHSAIILVFWHLYKKDSLFTFEIVYFFLIQPVFNKVLILFEVIKQGQKRPLIRSKRRKCLTFWERERRRESNLPLSPSCQSHFDFAIVYSLKPVFWPGIHGMTHKYLSESITHYPKVKHDL